VIEAKRNWPELLAGLGIICVGLLIGYQATTLKVISVYANVGPAAFLWFAAALLLLCGAIVAFHAFHKPADKNNELQGPVIILAGLLLSVFTLEPFGFIPTATMIFAMTARGVGSRKLVRDVLIGVTVSTVAYVVFGWGLGLRLPIGNIFA
jgi:putative tricarboxylic transport membrane protein